MKQLFFVVLILFGLKASCQNEISTEMLNAFRKDFKESPKSAALQNAISSNSLNALTINRNSLADVDVFFSHQVKTAGITDQKSSGRCWMFTGFNVLRPVAAANMNSKEIKFSHSYLFFYDQLEKANLFLEGIINTLDKPLDDKRVEWLLKNPIGDGGQWTGVVDLVTKYGVVPEDVMPESYHSENTSAMSRILATNLRANATKLRQMHADGKALKIIQEHKTSMVNEVYRILALSLGEPPISFQWRFEDKEGNISPLETYTPKSFYEKWIHVNLSDYVMFMNDPSRPYYKLYEIDYDRHTVDGGNWKYINLPTKEIKKFAVESIKSNEAMYFSCDVGKQLDMSRGYLDTSNFAYQQLFDVNLSMNKAERIQTFSSGSSHGMALVAVDVDENGNPVKWLLENSWGMKGHKGHLIMTDEWFDEYMFRLVVHKKYITKEVLDILKTEAIMLPPWDPMFSPEF
ncbi:MAG: C1 family peptidase [Bacteroidales bacterium]|nr:C1 family peptidase [Bacteroidales bacterium]